MSKHIKDPILREKKIKETRKKSYEKLKKDPVRWKNRQEQRKENSKKIRSDEVKMEKLREKARINSWIIRNKAKLQHIKNHSQTKTPDISRIWDESDKLLPDSLRHELQNKRLQILNEY